MNDYPTSFHNNKIKPSKQNISTLLIRQSYILYKTTETLT